MSKYKVTQTVYMIASNKIVQPVIIKRISDDERSYLVGFEMAGEMWIPESRLFSNIEAAKAYLEQFKKERKSVRRYQDKLH